MKEADKGHPKSQDPQNGTASIRGKQSNREGSNGISERNGSHKSTNLGRSSSLRAKNGQREDSCTSDSKDAPPKKEAKNGAASSETRKPWIPCTRRPSKPKPLPDILDMDLLMNSNSVCKKFPKSPTIDSNTFPDAEKNKGKQATETVSSAVKNGGGGSTNTNGNTPAFDRLVSSNGNSSIINNNTTMTSSMERRARSLKRQFALDRATSSNLKESISNESLNSINSVTQLLKIERSAYALNRKRDDDDDKEDKEELTGVKLIAARLEAKNAKNAAPNKNGVKNSGMCENGLLQNKYDGNTSNSKTRPGHLQTEQTHKDSTQKIADKEKSTSISISTTSTITTKSLQSALKEPQEGIRTTQQVGESSHSVAAGTSSSILFAATAAAVSSPPVGRKKLNSSKTSTSTSTPSSGKSPSQVTSSRSSSPEKRQQQKQASSAQSQNVKSQSKPSIRSRSNSPVKYYPSPSPTVKPTSPDTPTVRSRPGSVSTTANPCSNKKPNLNSSRSSSLSRKTPVASSETSTSTSSSSSKATAASLIKQGNQIKDKKEDSTSPQSTQRSRSSRISSSSKSNLINAKSSLDNASKVGGQNGITENHSGRGRSRKREDLHSSSPLKRYALPTIASRASKNNSPVRKAGNLSRQDSLKESSLSRDTSLTRARKLTEEGTGEEKKSNSNKTIKRGKLILEDKVTKEDSCKLESDHTDTGRGQTKAVVGSSKNSSTEDVLDYSLSSSSIPSASSSSIPCSPSTSWRSRRRQSEQPRIIPSIIMSEYVEGGGGNGKASTVVGRSKSLFSPLQIIEPLQPTCDIAEGSSLELKVRIRGAEAVIWVKENKVIPNAPPDIQYFSEKSKDLYGLRIADVFLQDAGLYVCEAYGTGGSEVTCWCEVDVIETSGQDDDSTEEDISWEDLDLSEEVKNTKPLVVPVIVTSQAVQEREPTSTFETTQSKEPSPVRNFVPVKLVNEDEEPEPILTAKDCLAGSSKPDCDLSIANNRFFARKSANNESASSATATMKKSQSALGATAISFNEGECASIVEEGVTEFASESTAIASPPVATAVIPEEEVRDKEDYEDKKESAGERSQSQQSGDSVGHVKQKLTSQLSSASDESIYLKEPRSGDEGALSSNEDTSGASISFLDRNRKRSTSTAANDEDNTTLTSESPAASSPFSEQNNDRSSSVDSAIGFLGRPLFSDGKFPPRILVGPSNIIALSGELVHLRVKVQNYGIPKTSVNWFKFVNGTYKKIEYSTAAAAAPAGDQSTAPEEPHICISKAGASLSTLTITQINYDDCGRYRVKVQNLLGMDSHDCLLTVEGPPEPPTTPPKVKYDEKSKTILIQWSSCPYDGGSKITGYYVEASIVQSSSSKTSVNNEDQDTWQLLTPQSYSWLCYTLTEPKRGSVYRFRVLGENIYGKGKPTQPSLPLLVPILMEGRRAGSSDALLWSLKSLSPEETSLRADSGRNAHKCESEMASLEESAASQEEEEPLEYKNVTVRRESFYNVYEKLDELGKGRFGVVFEVSHKETKKAYAGKFVKCIKGKDKERVQLEVQIMNDLAYHPKLICLIDAFEMPREIVIVTQQINGGELFERVVADDFTLTEGDCIDFLRQICDAVGYIHQKNIMHLDLKPENILCTSKNSNLIKIIDFGLAQYHDPEEPIRVLFGTAEFVSPEIINYEPIAPSTDNWSVGVITYILLSGLSPFMGDNDNETFSNIKQNSILTMRHSKKSPKMPKISFPIYL